MAWCHTWCTIYDIFYDPTKIVTLYTALIFSEPKFLIFSNTHRQPQSFQYFVATSQENFLSIYSAVCEKIGTYNEVLDRTTLHIIDCLLISATSKALFLRTWKIYVRFADCLCQTSSKKQLLVWLAVCFHIWNVETGISYSFFCKKKYIFRT